VVDARGDGWDGGCNQRSHSTRRQRLVSHVAQDALEELRCQSRETCGRNETAVESQGTRATSGPLVPESRILVNGA
jgi:hypothetical protein